MDPALQQVILICQAEEWTGTKIKALEKSTWQTALSTISKSAAGEFTETQLTRPSPGRADQNVNQHMKQPV